MRETNTAKQVYRNHEHLEKLAQPLSAPKHRVRKVLAYVTSTNHTEEESLEDREQDFLT